MEVPDRICSVCFVRCLQATDRLARLSRRCDRSNDGPPPVATLSENRRSRFRRGLRAHCGSPVYRLRNTGEVRVEPQASLPMSKYVRPGPHLHRISEAASLVGVSSATLRLWEGRGLISSQRSPAGYRLYSAEDIRRLCQVQRLRNSGVNLAGIDSILPKNVNDHRRQANSEPFVGRFIGRKLRQLRQSGGLSIAEVGERAGLSTSFVSLVERGMSGASVISLEALCRALGTNFRRLMGDEGTADRRMVPASSRRRLPSMDSGIKIEQLVEGNASLDCQLFTVAPGRHSDGTYAHEGEEFVFVLSGSIEIKIDHLDSFVLKKGDSLHFKSTSPHSWRGLGKRPCVVLWIDVRDPDSHLTNRVGRGTANGSVQVRLISARGNAVPVAQHRPVRPSRDRGRKRR
jgi:DNA-binding transcriptional MerR regulator/quercetin dioxygenase-like cupin family protein